MYFKYAHLRIWGEMTRISGIWLKIFQRKGIKPNIEEKDVDKQLPMAVEWVKENIK